MPAASVQALEYEAHDSMALRMLERIADEIAERFDVTGSRSSTASARCRWAT